MGQNHAAHKHVRSLCLWDLQKCLTFCRVTSISLLPLVGRVQGGGAFLDSFKEEAVRGKRLHQSHSFSQLLCHLYLDEVTGLGQGW